MPSASITSTILGVPVVAASRNDAVLGSIVTLASTNVHTTYAWTLAYKPSGSAAVFSGSANAASPGTFTVDLEGPYLIRLTADLGLSTESTQFIRVRYPTVLGSLNLVAAGEGYGGEIPVPVDQTSTGWTDAQNANLLALLGLVSGTLMSGRVLNVDSTAGYGDYTTIQAAINAAVVAGATASTPYVVQVRPGVYTENLAFASGVYVVGSPGTPADLTGTATVLVRGAHTVASAGAGERVLIHSITLENITASTNATLRKTGVGALTLYQCVLSQTGTDALQGPALQVDAGTVTVYECVLSTDSATASRAAVTQPSTSSLSIYRSRITGPTGMILNSSFAASVSTQLVNTTVTGNNAAGGGIVSDAGTLSLQSSIVTTTTATSVDIHPGAGAFATTQAVTITYSRLSGTIDFDTTGIVGATTLNLGASSYSGLSFPGGNPTNLVAVTEGTSIFYDNTTSGLTAENVQEALDELDVLVDAVRTLDDAYDGGVPASGGGRTIVADQGFVQIVDASVPSNPPEAGSTNGGLDVVSGVKVGAIGAPEIDVNPNPYGAGPAITMGNRVVPSNHPWGAGTAMVMGNSTGTPLFRNYDQRVQTKSSTGGGFIGRLILQGGDGLPNGATTPDASSVYVQAGSAFDATAVPGNVYIAYGSRTGGASGSLILVRPEGSTAATLTAAGACADPIGVNGSITFATNMGAVTLDVTAAQSRATVITNLAALEGITAVDSGGGVIRLTTDHLGANAEVYFLSATAGVDAAIGVFDGQAQVDGTYGAFIDVQVSADQEVSFGVTGTTGPLIYNADTGKLTVPGVIDPTAIVFEEAGAPGTSATEGAVFVSDGSGGLIAGSVYYQGPSNAAPALFATTGATGSFLIHDAVQNAVSDALTIAHTYNAGSGANNIGVGLLFRSENSVGSTEDAGRIAGILTNATDGAEVSTLAFYTRTAGGALTSTMTLTTALLAPVTDVAVDLGSPAQQWATIAYLDEISTGQKQVSVTSKVFGDSPYTVGATDYIILYDPTGGGSTVNLPAAATNTNRMLTIKHASASGNTVTVDANAAETIDGNLVVVLSTYQSITLVCNGVGWFIV